MDSCDPVDCSPPGSSVRGILQAGMLEWVAISSSSGSSPPRDQTQVSSVSCTGKWVLYHLSQQGSLSNMGLPLGSTAQSLSFALTGEGVRVPGSILEHQQGGHCRHHHSCACRTQHCRVGAEGRVRWERVYRAGLEPLLNSATVALGHHAGRALLLRLALHLGVGEWDQEQAST